MTRKQYITAVRRAYTLPQEALERATACVHGIPVQYTNIEAPCLLALCYLDGAARAIPFSAARKMRVALEIEANRLSPRH